MISLVSPPLATNKMVRAWPIIPLTRFYLRETIDILFSERRSIVVNRLLETTREARAAIGQRFRRQKQFGAQVNAAVVQRKQYPMKFPVGVVAQQFETRRNSQGLDAERKLEAEPQRLRIDNEIGLGRIGHLFETAT